MTRHIQLMLICKLINKDNPSIHCDSSMCSVKNVFFLFLFFGEVNTTEKKNNVICMKKLVQARI